MTRNFNRILITGGAGFIGSHFAKYVHGLLKDVENAKIIILDAITYAGNLYNIEDILDSNKVIFVRGNINDIKLVSDIFAEYQPQCVVNFAAETHVDRSITGPRVFLETNVMGTQTLLDVALDFWTKQGTLKNSVFLQVSTDEVYGSLSRTYELPVKQELGETLRLLVGSRRNVITFGEKLFDENTPIAPRSPYSASKAAADMLVLAYGETFGMPVVITRCSNNYGPNQFPEKLIPLMINNLREGKNLPVYGEGKNVRDWLYVEDHARAIYQVLLNGRLSEVYNIGGLNEQENISIVKTIIKIFAQITGTEPRYDLITYVTDRPGHDMRYAIDPTKTANELGWAPQTPFEQGIEKTIRWYIENTGWLDKVISGEYRNFKTKNS